MEYIMFNEEYPFIEWNNQFIEDYTVFCESDDNLTDDVEEAAPGPYEKWLKLNDYDPKTNTIDIYGKRYNVGKIGSSKEKNRRNQFLKRHNFDPTTSTYLSDIPLANGSKARVPLYIGAGKSNGETLKIGTISSPYNSSSRINSLNYYIDYDNSNYTRLQDLNEEIKYFKDRLDNGHPNYHGRENDENILADLKKQRNEAIKDLKTIPLKQRDKYAKNQQQKIIGSTGTSLPTSVLSAKPKYSDFYTKHEEGHEEVSLNRGRFGDNDVHPGYDKKKATKFLRSKGPYGSLRNREYMSDHDKEPEEHYADIYGVKNNKYIKSKQDAIDTTRRALDSLSYDADQKALRNIKYKVKQNKRNLKNMQANSNDGNRFWNNPEFWNGVKKSKDLENQLAGEKFVNKSIRNKNNMHNDLRSQLLATQLSDDDFKGSGDPSRRPKTNKERAKERKERGDLTRKAKIKMKQHSNQMTNSQTSNRNQSIDKEIAEAKDTIKWIRDTLDTCHVSKRDSYAAMLKDAQDGLAYLENKKRQSYKEYMI